MWFSEKITPIVTSVLPRLPRKKPALNKCWSSCELIHREPISSADTSTSRIEMYHHSDRLWVETVEEYVNDDEDFDGENDNDDNIVKSSIVEN